MNHYMWLGIPLLIFLLFLGCNGVKFRDNFQVKCDNLHGEVVVLRGVVLCLKQGSNLLK